MAQLAPVSAISLRFFPNADGRSQVLFPHR
jgi:hypothetical protein